MFPSIMIVDDEPTILQSLSGLLRDEGFDVITASNGYEALKIIDSDPPDLVLLDIWMPGIDGIETLKMIKSENPAVQVIIITGHGTIETAVKATKHGAFDLIEKPLSIDRVIVAINNALNFRRLEEENKYLRKKTIEKNAIDGKSPPIQELMKQISIAAPSDKWILIKGENGTGKELVARTIHQFSSRAEQPLVDVNCAAIPEELIECELFGHEKGVYSDAKTKKRGKFELAGEGTLFLDEIGDMSLKTQGKLLRVLQEQKYQRVGGSRTLDVKARVIAATNKDLEKEIERGTFREDFYYRLNVIPIEVPPLRERRADIPILVERFLKKSTEQNRDNEMRMTREAVELLQQYVWPGNVRELKNLVERLALMTGKEVIEPTDIPAPYNPDTCSGANLHPMQPFAVDRLAEAKKAFENEFIKSKFIYYDNNLDKTAKALGVENRFLKEKLAAMGLLPEEP